MNIVFDLGGVVFNWNPDKIIYNFFDDKDTQNIIKKEIFQHPDWLLLDRGTLSKEDAVIRGAKRTGLSESIINQLLDTVPESLTPKKDTVELLHYLKKTPHYLYVLSNMHYASIEYLETHHAFWDIFEGKVFSCHIHKIKPEPEIYQYLLEKFTLEATETVFIDDMPENLEAAAKFGIKTIHFQNASQCKNNLLAMKIT